MRMTRILPTVWKANRRPDEFPRLSFELAPADASSTRVAPAFIDVYEADWVVQP